MPHWLHLITSTYFLTIISSLIARTMGERYRREMLAHGGGKHPSDLVQGKPLIIIIIAIHDRKWSHRFLKVTRYNFQPSRAC